MEFELKLRTFLILQMTKKVILKIDGRICKRIEP